MTLPPDFEWPKTPRALMIYDLQTKRFSSGGMDPLHPYGSPKIWKSAGNINSHLSLLREGRGNSKKPESVYRNCVVLDVIAKEIVPWSNFKIEL